MHTDQQVVKAVRLAALVAVLLFLAVLTGQTFAQGNLEASMTAEPTEATVGDPILRSPARSRRKPPTEATALPQQPLPSMPAFLPRESTPRRRCSWR